MSEFDRPRGATIVFSDVFGDIPIGERAPKSIVDFDAVITDDVNNQGRFHNGQFPIGAWPEIGEYGAVLVEHLRESQMERAEKEGVDSDNLEDVIAEGGLHPDILTLAESLLKTVVVVVNHAPRTADHHASRKNGDEFYAGITQSGVQVFAQLPYFRGLQARGLLRDFYRIPNNSGLWIPKEQYRSSSVTQARTRPELLQPADPNQIPQPELEGRVAYADFFGNVRLEVKNVKPLRDLLAEARQVRLRIDGVKQALMLAVGSSLEDNDPNQLSIYFNPADKPADQGPAYVEIARRVDDPVGNQDHAYSRLSRLAAKGSGLIDPRQWNNLNIEIDA